MPELTPEIDSTGGESQKKKRRKKKIRTTAIIKIDSMSIDLKPFSKASLKPLGITYNTTIVIQNVPRE
jgi:putative aminopeptidase FrvX